MGAVELDRQAIERRDFPIVRRGYDPASVDAHLRALAADVEELRREASSRGNESLASVAGTQVQGILEAAQATAETIEREAAQSAQEVREAADVDARRTREEAIARAQEHVAAVSQATDVLLARVGTMDSETQTLIESLRSGASQLAGDLAAVETNMSALYDAAAGRAGGGEAPAEPVTSSPADDYEAAGAPAAEPLQETPFVDSPGQSDGGVQDDTFAGEVHAEAIRSEVQATPSPGSQPSEAARAQEPPSAGLSHGEPAATSPSEDLDGARLVALNMALNGDSREETGQYLAENFDVSDRERLLDEVYAAIEG
jgi:DivIVA domain-containing protein